MTISNSKLSVTYGRNLRFARKTPRTYRIIGISKKLCAPCRKGRNPQRKPNPQDLENVNPKLNEAYPYNFSLPTWAKHTLQLFVLVGAIVVNFIDWEGEGETMKFILPWTKPFIGRAFLITYACFSGGFFLGFIYGYTFKIIKPIHKFKEGLSREEMMECVVENIEIRAKQGFGILPLSEEAARNAALAGKRGFVAYMVNPSSANTGEFPRRFMLWSGTNLFASSCYLVQFYFHVLYEPRRGAVSFLWGLVALLCFVAVIMPLTGRRYGWSWRVGGFARQIRRECTVSDPTDLEKAKVETRDQLEWWVGQILKVDSDSPEIQEKAESTLIQ